MSHCQVMQNTKKILRIINCLWPSLAETCCRKILIHKINILSLSWWSFTLLLFIIPSLMVGNTQTGLKCTQNILQLVLEECHMFKYTDYKSSLSCSLYESEAQPVQCQNPTKITGKRTEPGCKSRVKQDVRGWNLPVENVFRRNEVRTNTKTFTYYIYKLHQVHGKHGMF